MIIFKIFTFFLINYRICLFNYDNHFKISGQNCILPNGSLLNGSESQMVNGINCRCPHESDIIGSGSEEYFTAICDSSSTTQTTTEMSSLSPSLDRSSSLFTTQMTSASPLTSPDSMTSPESMTSSTPLISSTPITLPTSTTPIISTTMRGCWSQNGLYLDLLPGQSIVIGCFWCVCLWGSEGYCADGAWCPPLTCQNVIMPPPESCRCPVCSNGNIFLAYWTPC